MESDVRRTQNESWFRALNERLEDRVLARSGNRLDTEMLIICECSREECTERISLPVGEYELVRAHPRTFVLARGHADTRFERVLIENADHEIVEKFGEAGLLAQLENARGPT